jgi:hypothetical protein
MAEIASFRFLQIDAGRAATLPAFASFMSLLPIFAALTMGIGP